MSQSGYRYGLHFFQEGARSCLYFGKHGLNGGGNGPVCGSKKAIQDPETKSSQNTETIKLTKTHDMYLAMPKFI